MAKIYVTYPQGKFKALTMSYDDGRKADKRLVEIFNRNGIKGTFHINSGFFGNTEYDRMEEAECVELYKGHEVSAHTLTPPRIGRCPKEMLVHE